MTEWDEPQAVIGSNLHRMAYPDKFAAPPRARRPKLQEAYHHHGDSELQTTRLQLRGEYLYAANGPEGLRVYDVAKIDNKGFSRAHRHRAGVAARPAAPTSTTQVRHRRRPAHQPCPSTSTATTIPANEEQPIHPLYRYAFVTDRDEGLIVVDVDDARRRRPAATTSSSAPSPSIRTARSTARASITIAGDVSPTSLQRAGWWW